MRYRLQRHDGTDCSATMVPITVLRMVPIQRYRQSIYQLLYYKIRIGHVSDSSVIDENYLLIDKKNGV